MASQRTDESYSTEEIMKYIPLHPPSSDFVHHIMAIAVATQVVHFE